MKDDADLIQEPMDYERMESNSQRSCPDNYSSDKVPHKSHDEEGSFNNSSFSSGREARNNFRHNYSSEKRPSVIETPASHIIECS